MAGIHDHNVDEPYPVQSASEQISDRRRIEATGVVKPQQTPVSVELKEETNDPRAATTRRLLKYIARAQAWNRRGSEGQPGNKSIAVTGWMALALVARDQGLDMDSVIQALS